MSSCHLRKEVNVATLPTYIYNFAIVESHSQSRENEQVPVQLDTSMILHNLTDLNPHPGIHPQTMSRFILFKVHKLGACMELERASTMSRCFWFSLGCYLNQLATESFAYPVSQSHHNLQSLFARSRPSVAGSGLNTLQTLTDNSMQCSVVLDHLILPPSPTFLRLFLSALFSHQGSFEEIHPQETMLSRLATNSGVRFVFGLIYSMQDTFNPFSKTIPHAQHTDQLSCVIPPTVHLPMPIIAPEPVHKTISLVLD